MEKSPVYGLRWGGLYASYDPELSLWKMSQLSLFEDWTEYSDPLPKWGMMRNGALYQLETWEPLTSESAGSVSHTYPTPCASDPDKQCTGGLHRMIVQGKRYSDGDHRAVKKRYLTPTAHLHKEANYPAERKRDLLTPQVTPPGVKAIVAPNFCEWLMGFPIDWTKID